jgi:protein-tyrosine-phosphatase/drug/metabolite transporter (DMT)-like permease
VNRRYSLGIWGLALGYFIFYLPYCALIKAITTGLWPGGPVSGFELLPATVIATAVVVLVIITAMGWWKYAGRREILGFRIPFPSRWTLLSGLGFAVIIGTTTLAYTFSGVSILLALLMLRGGVLILAPIVDGLFKREVRWFSWTALVLSFMGLAVALTDVQSYQMTAIAALNIAAYLTGYLLRLPCMNRWAKSEDKKASYRYFVEEQMVAMPVLVAVPAIFALIGQGEIMMELRRGFTSFLESDLIGPALLVGALYAGLCAFGTLIYLDRRENTFCIPLNRCTSLLSGVAASYALAFLFQQAPPSHAQLLGAGLIMIAILVLSPLHHLRLYLARIERVLRSARREMRDPWYIGQLQRVLLFVCSGNTSRSPIAQAICTMEMARRLNIPLEALSEFNVQVMSAGLSAKPGTPMAPEVQLALRQLGVPAFLHVAQQLTAEMVEQAGVIFCMTENQRQAIIDRVPAAAARVRCLDPSGDIEDPTGTGPEALLNCARRIQSLVRQRLDRIGLAQA